MTEMICFDMDCTLVRSNKLHLKSFNAAFKHNKLPTKTPKEILPVFSQRSYLIIKAMHPHLSHSQIQKVSKDHIKFTIKMAKGNITRIRGVIGTLKKLKKHYKIAILSNCSHKEIDAITKAAGIDENMFDLIIGANEVKHSKPAPDEMFKAEKLLKIKKGYMVGDSIYDIIAGKKAGLKTIGVTTGNHTKKELLKYKPTKVFKSVIELPKYLIKD